MSFIAVILFYDLRQTKKPDAVRESDNLCMLRMKIVHRGASDLRNGINVYSVWCLEIKWPRGLEDI